MFMEAVTRFVYFLLLLYAAFQRGHRKEGEWLSFSLFHFPGHELFNGFSHLCVWGDMVCIHSAVTGTTWGSKPMERLLMCKHHINPSLRLPPPAPLSHTQGLMSHLQPKKSLFFHSRNLVAPPQDTESLIPCSSFKLQPLNDPVPLFLHFSWLWSIKATPFGATVLKRRKSRIVGA